MHQLLHQLSSVSYTHLDVYKRQLQASTGNPYFNNANLGAYCEGSSSLVFKGAEHNNYKCGGCDITSTRLMYRIYPVGFPSGSFVSNSIGYSSGFTNGCGGEDQQWSNICLLYTSRCV